MVDLTAKPFYLGKEEIEWVEEQITGMTLEEKLVSYLLFLTRIVILDI